MANGKAGRPSKLTPELVEAVCERCRKGIDPMIAAMSQGITERTYREWRAQANEGTNEAAADFFQQAARACAEAEVAFAERLASGDDVGVGFGSAKAALEILQRRYPKRWSAQLKVEMTDQLNRFLDAAQRVCDAETFGKLLAELAEESGAGEAPPAPEHPGIH